MQKKKGFTMNMQILGSLDDVLKSRMNALEEDQENMEKCAMHHRIKELVLGILKRSPEQRLEAHDFVEAWVSRIGVVFDKEIRKKQLKLDFVCTHQVGGTAYGTIFMQFVTPICA